MWWFLRSRIKLVSQSCELMHWLYFHHDSDILDCHSLPVLMQNEELTTSIWQWSKVVVYSVVYSVYRLGLRDTTASHMLWLDLLCSLRRLWFLSESSVIHTCKIEFKGYKVLEMCGWVVEEKTIFSCTKTTRELKMNENCTHFMCHNHDDLILLLH